MASHFLLYAAADAREAYACAADADEARTFAQGEALAGRATFPHVVRKLTGCCPICGKSISRLTGRDQPRQMWEIPA